MDARSFAYSLIAELRSRDPRAQSLRTRGQGKTAVIGFEDEGEFVPVFMLTGASAKFNVMSLLVNHHGKWQPTFKRATPALLAQHLAAEFHYLWTIPLELANFDPNQEP